MQKINWAFFGTSKISVIVLDKMKEKGLLPSLIITSEDKPKGRKMELAPSEVKIWAESEKIPYIQPEKLKDALVEKDIKMYGKDGFDVFVVASYGKIIPKNILDIPRYQTLNVHPSLLPKLRGPSPIKSAILEESETGVTIMLVDELMDHGPIIEQKKIDIEWPPYENDLEKVCGEIGGDLLSEIIPKWIDGKIEAKEQDHSKATLCKKITKSQGEISLNDSPEINLRKIRAFHNWPTAYTFYERNGKKIRLNIKRARIENGELILERVVPEGKKRWTILLS